MKDEVAALGSQPLKVVSVVLVDVKHHSVIELELMSVVE